MNRNLLRTKGVFNDAGHIVVRSNGFLPWLSLPRDIARQPRERS